MSNSLRPVKFSVTFSVESADGDGTVDDETYTVHEDEKEAIERRMQNTDDPFVEFRDDDDDIWMMRKSIIRRVQIEQIGRKP